MDLMQLSETAVRETIEGIFAVTVIPGVTVGVAVGIILHLAGFAVFRVLALLNTK